MTEYVMSLCDRKIREQLIFDFNLDLGEYLNCKYKGYQVRYCCDGTLQFSPVDGFDRWANSDNIIEFEIWQPKGLRQLGRFLKEIDNANSYEESCLP